MLEAACPGKALVKDANGKVRDIFFPRKGEKEDAGIAVCFTCSKIIECDDWAVRSNAGHGIWGGRRRGGQNDSKNY